LYFPSKYCPCAGDGTGIGFEPSSRNRTLDQLHKELREFERIDAVSDEMRTVIEAATAAGSAPSRPVLGHRPDPDLDVAQIRGRATTTLAFR
jgi:hypothetical protein